MADWATYVVVPGDAPDGGAPEVYEARFGAVGIDLDLLASGRTRRSCGTTVSGSAPSTRSTPTTRRSTTPARTCAW
ncbi:hypothetical protein ABT160_27855 [Streptomyces sp. NPDC001941]|uniref:hypothetical protein n=1 Tax=Streptomyces sp. NPDC001941 TaxID=3154659 RepID=UPI0033181605